MQRTSTITVVCALLFSGCGQFKLPKPTKPDELPTPAQLLKRAPDFLAQSADFSEVEMKSLVGRPAVLIGVDWKFAGEADEWAAVIQRRFGTAGEHYQIIKIVEDEKARIGLLAKLEEVSPKDTDFYVSGDYAEAYGFANLEAPSEGPHLAIIGPDGTLLGSVDGTATHKRAEKVFFALQAHLTPLAKANE